MRSIGNMSLKILFLLTLILMAAVPSYKDPYYENTQDLLLSIDFEKGSESVFSDSNAKRLAYSAGVDGKGLDLESCLSI